MGLGPATAAAADHERYADLEDAGRFHRRGRSQRHGGGRGAAGKFFGGSGVRPLRLARRRGVVALGHGDLHRQQGKHPHASETGKRLGHGGKGRPDDPFLPAGRDRRLVGPSGRGEVRGTGIFRPNGRAERPALLWQRAGDGRPRFRPPPPVFRGGNQVARAAVCRGPCARAGGLGGPGNRGQRAGGFFPHLDAHRGEDQRVAWPVDVGLGTARPADRGNSVHCDAGPADAVVSDGNGAARGGAAGGVSGGGSDRMGVAGLQPVDRTAAAGAPSEFTDRGAAQATA